MGKAVTVVARLLAAFFAFLFVLSATAFIFAFVARVHLLRPAPYKQALAEVNAYDQAPAALAELLAMAGGPQRSAFLQLQQEDYEILLQRVLPREWLQSQTEAIIDHVFAATDAPGEAPTMTISLAALKQNLDSEAGGQALLEIIRRRPACSIGDLSALTCGFDLSGAIQCRPPEPQLQLCGEAASGAFAAAAATLPDQITLSGLLQAGAPLRQLVEEAGGPYPALVRQTARFGWVAALFFLLLVTAFGARSLRSLLLWWGAPVVALGAALVLLALFTWLAPTWFLNYVLADVQAAAPQLGRLLMEAVAVLGRRMALWLGVAGMAAGAGGLILALVSFLAPRPRRQTQQR
ncbi:MAG TPA: hypothetical protein VK879_23390 [Candidatus Sulfomarinibacteraceae bacterium]|nr:hypothetical protein [Candidatus Sulfomarinibacteraceae bacterium]